MQASLPEATGEEASRWALFLDIDGTLMDIAITPNAVRVPPTLPVVLDGWRDKLQGAMALVSGRSLMQIDRLFAPHRYDASGSHGHEWRQDGVAELIGEDRSAEIASVVSYAESQIFAFPGLALERKPHSLAIHYRAAPHRRFESEQVAARIVARLGPGFRVISGKAVTEILIDGTDKATAITRFMECETYRGRRPVFAGDDLSDEPGFAAVNRLGGISIHIGNEPRTEAQARLPSPSSLRDWLSAAIVPSLS